MMIFEKNVLHKKQIGFNILFLAKFLDDSAWFCVEKLKKHVFETNKFKDQSKIQKEIWKHT